jgi:hypothetical protein
VTENWIEMSVRFVALDHGVRGIKDAMTRDIMAGLKEAGVGIAAIRQQGIQKV